MIFEKHWAMPNKNTFDIKPINNFVKKYLKENIVSIDPFANKNRLASITNDLDFSMGCDYCLDAIDFLKMFENQSVDLVLFDPPYCYDKQTEVMTKNGWKFFEDLTSDDYIATLNTTNNNLEYHKPIEIIKQPYKGKMVYYNSQSINLLVTPNHKIWSKNSFYGKYSFKDAINTINKKSWMQKTCDYVGEEKEFFILPKVNFNRQNRYGEKYKSDKYIKMDVWLKFLGLYLSEGCCKNSLNKPNNYLIIITQKKEHNLLEFESVLNELGYKWYRDDIHYKIHDKQLYTYLSKYGKSHDKYIDDDIKNLSKRQLNILLKYLMMGDGTNIKYPKLNKTVNKIYHYTTNSYYTASKKLMYDMSEICIKCGFGITVTTKKKIYNDKVYDLYNIHMLGSKHFRINSQNVSVIENFDDYVYCAVVPNSTMYVKRNGRCVWSGNSPRQVSESYKKLDKTVNMETTQASFWGNLKKEIGRIVKPDGIVLCFGWNSGGIGKKLGFEMIEIQLISHGGNHNDTICTAEIKL